MNLRKIAIIVNSQNRKWIQSRSIKKILNSKWIRENDSRCIYRKPCIYRKQPILKLDSSKICRVTRSGIPSGKILYRRRRMLYRVKKFNLVPIAFPASHSSHRINQSDAIKSSFQNSTVHWPLGSPFGNTNLFQKS